MYLIVDYHNRDVNLLWHQYTVFTGLDKGTVYRNLSPTYGFLSFTLRTLMHNLNLFRILFGICWGMWIFADPTTDPNWLSHERTAHGSSKTRRSPPVWPTIRGGSDPRGGGGGDSGSIPGGRGYIGGCEPTRGVNDTLLLCVLANIVTYFLKPQEVNDILHFWMHANMLTCLLACLLM